MPDGFWDQAAAAASGLLTEEQFIAATEAIRNQAGQSHPCKLGHHVVSPRALTRPGTYRCVNCLTAVEIPYPLIEHA